MGSAGDRVEILCNGFLQVERSDRRSSDGNTIVGLQGEDCIVHCLELFDVAPEQQNLGTVSSAFEGECMADAGRRSGDGYHAPAELAG